MLAVRENYKQIKEMRGFVTQIVVYRSVVDCRERPMCRSVARRFRFVCGNAPHPLVWATPCGRPWQELQRLQFARCLEGAQILVYVDL